MSKRRKTSLVQKAKAHRKITAALAVCLIALVGVLLMRFSSAAVYDNVPDISSPQCGNNGIVNGRRNFGIVGLNGTYMNFGTNPCVREQANLFLSYDVYVGANYPSSHCAGKSAFACGQAAAQHNLNLMSFLALKPTRVWIDVETGPKIKWSSDKNQNNAFFFFFYSGINAQHALIGHYSNQQMCQSITRGANLGGSGNWYATGRTNPTDALAYCGMQFGGAANIYVQYIENGVLDVNRSCSQNGKSIAPSAPQRLQNPKPSK